MKRALVISNDVIGTRMAGPGIRYFHFARELAKRLEVTLLTPHPIDVELDGVDVLAGRPPGFAYLRKLVPRFDVVISQQLGVPTTAWLARTDTRVIFDLYVPYMTEDLAAQAQSSAPLRARRTAYALATLAQDAALATGNAFICASERQRDLWLGRLGALGRLDLSAYARDPAFRNLIDVVPFGLEPDPPGPAKPTVKDVIPGIEPDDRLLLWAGGIWNWFDPLTVIRAVGEVAKHRADVKLLFLGVRHPNPAVGEMEMTQRAVELARELDLENRFVFFNFGWVPYHERAGYFAEADLGVSAHFEALESRYAFRTRLLDHFWAELPTIATGGDTLGDLIGERRLGRTVGPEDIDGWVRAIEELLDDPAAYEEAKSNIEPVRREYEWPRVTRRLLELAEVPGERVDPPRSIARLTARSLRLELDAAPCDLHGRASRIGTAPRSSKPASPRCMRRPTASSRPCSSTTARRTARSTPSPSGSPRFASCASRGTAASRRR